jgi:hypothetical protein
VPEKKPLPLKPWDWTVMLIGVGIGSADRDGDAGGNGRVVAGGLAIGDARRRRDGRGRTGAEVGAGAEPATEQLEIARPLTSRRLSCLATIRLGCRCRVL